MLFFLFDVMIELVYCIVEVWKKNVDKLESVVIGWLLWYFKNYYGIFKFNWKCIFLFDYLIIKLIVFKWLNKV